MNQAFQLLSDIWGSTTGHFRVFHDSIRDPKLARKIQGDFNTVAAELSAYNQQGYGVYAVVNHGGNDDANVTHSTAIMIDLDGDAGLPNTWHLTPHIITRKGETGNYHAYWLLNETTDIHEWSRTCKRLIAQYGSDPRIHNPSRVMRLPDFLHLKNPDAPDMYNVIYRSDHARYDLDTVAQGLPEVSHEAVSNGARGETLIESDDVFAVDRATQHLTKCTPSIEGDSGNHHAFAAAARCRDLGLSESKTFELMIELFNPRCEPPWDADELAVPVGNAYRYAASEQGKDNPLGVFQSLGMTPSAAPSVPAAPAQTVTPDAPITTVAPATTSHVVGIDPFDITVGCGYTKNHTENAGRFLQENYPARTLVVYKEDFYYFDGKSYVTTTAQDMKTGLTFAMANATPSDSDINGALNLVKALSNRPVTPGEYAGRDSTGLILLQNGILDITTNELLPHTRDYFSTNILPYDYDPNAACPTWDAFLQSTFEGDQERVDFIEEWLGYMMVRDYSYQKIAMLIGAPRSGKTLIANITTSLIGDSNFMGIDLDGFADNGTLEQALDKPVLWVGDAGTISGPNRGKIVDRLKTISGDGAISCSRKYKSAFSGRIPGRITITCNNVLTFSDDSGALAGRFVICPFNKSFKDKEDPTLLGRMQNELPGIANRCINALRRLRARGRFQEPAIAASERESITYRYSPVLAFINDECVTSDEQRVHGDQLYARYKMWCMRSGSKAIPQRTFVDAVRSATRGKTEKKVVSINGIKLQGFAGLGLVPNDEPDNVARMQGALV
ncbi:P-loop containing nucleoside triphosphate hydrolase [Vibrio phage 1.250.O._10N.261.55.E11]|nr:P-loop containing nucleoside triphosphate hydrolase [Vibrio phage 1.250.O._10N.261.55.E11]